MKVIFLDFDGVLNSAAFLLASPGRKDRLDPAAVERLNAIIERTGAKVVITSTWRIKRSLAELRDILAAVGMRGDIIDRTPIFSPGTQEAQGMPFPRCQEIEAWLGACAAPVESFVILDDADLEDAHAGAFGGLIVKTDFATGLLDADLALAISILGERS